MKFKIICQNNLSSNRFQAHKKQPETRPNSANKSIAAQSFRQMVRNTYDFYKTWSKDQLLKQSLQYVKIKQEKLKRVKILEQKRERAQQKEEEMKKQVLRGKRRQKRMETMKRKIQKQKIQPTRKSDRKKKYVESYVEEVRKKSLTEISIKDLQNDQNQILLQQALSKPSKKESLAKTQQANNNKQNHQIILSPLPSKQILLEFKEVGTYPLGLIHENILKIQQAIDTHLTFRKQMRKVSTIAVHDLVKYVRNQGFILLNEQTFYILTQINPDLYKLIQDTEDGHINILVLSYRIEEILRRKQQTKERMSQICVQEVFL